MSDDQVKCACGLPLHYGDPMTQGTVQFMVDHLGPDVEVVIGSRKWLVQRHYLALHGLKAVDLPELGFPEITQ